jgi:putative ABC transport system permease protein
MKDVRYALRTLTRSPGFTAVAVLSLALGIGANTAIFSVVNGVLLRPLPYREPGRIMMLHERLPKFTPLSIPFSPPDYAEVERRARSFSAIAAFQNGEYELSGIDRPARITGARASARLDAVLGVEPALGRWFTREEEAQRRRVAVLTYGLWRARFGGDPAVIGRTLALDRAPYTIVGVMPPGFEFPNRGAFGNAQPADLYIPMSFTRDELEAFGMMYNNSVVARLKPGVTPAQARAEVAALVGRFFEQYPAFIRSSGTFELAGTLEPYAGEITGGFRTPLLILLAAVGLVLLIGCADVANLMLARAAARRREMAVRMALGAGRGALLRQAFVESMALSLAGGALGLLFALWGTDALLRWAPVDIPRVASIHMDASVLAFTLAISMAAALVFGLAPAIEASRAAIGEALKESGRSSSPGRRTRRLFGAFVVAQFALAMVLLAGAGLLVRSFARLMAIDPGFQPAHAVSVRIDLPASAYAERQISASFYERLLARVAVLPGVETAAAASDLPLNTREGRVFTAEGPPVPGRAERVAINQHWVMGPYFQTLGIPLERGRYFTRQDGPGAPPAVIINETMARRFWPNQDPLGRRIKWGLAQSISPWMTIVGVVGDVRQEDLNVPIEPQTYTPYLQETREERRSMYAIVRARGDVGSGILAAVAALDPALPAARVEPLAAVVDDSLSSPRFSTFLLAAFAAAALLLASFGIAGVLSYSVTQRMHELGVRMAMGARRGDVLRLVLREGMRMAALGIAIGLAASLAAARVLSSLLYGVSPHDGPTFAAVAALLAAIALAACYVPARRAAKTDPISALRYE